MPLSWPGCQARRVEGVADVLFGAADGSVRHDFKGRIVVLLAEVRWTQVVLNRGDEGLRSALSLSATVDLRGRPERLAEQSEEKAEGLEVVQSDGLLPSGGPVAPWRLFVGDSVNPAVPVTAGRVTTEGSESLVLAERRSSLAGRRADRSNGRETEGASVSARRGTGGHQPRVERQHGSGFRCSGRDVPGRQGATGNGMR